MDQAYPTAPETHRGRCTTPPQLPVSCSSALIKAVNTNCLTQSPSVCQFHDSQSQSSTTMYTA